MRMEDGWNYFMPFSNYKKILRGE